MASDLVLGIDSSTQSTKALLVDAATGEVVTQQSARHPDGTSVDPRAWLDAFDEATSGLLERASAIAVGGQQHGMVALDGDDQPVHDAILWNDTRSSGEALDLIEELGGPDDTDRVGYLWKLPTSAAMDQLAYRVHAFAFPIWTFGALIAGPIWAQYAWGRYWGWDPKEVWAFITWVIYAGYLHARATAGWKGKAAAIIAIIGFVSFLFNFVGVNLFVPGLHSYAK